MAFAPVARRKNPLELEVRQNLFALISKSPGIHFRDIQRRSSMATGTLSYHLDQLVRVGLVKTIRDGEYLRYYAQSEMPEEEKRILELVRRPTVRHMMLSLIETGESSNDQLSEALSLCSSTVSWHIKKLVEANVLKTRVEGKRAFYSLDKPEVAKKVLIRYKESFMDKLVDKFVEMWEP